MRWGRRHRRTPAVEAPQEHTPEKDTERPEQISNGGNKPACHLHIYDHPSSEGSPCIVPYGVAINGVDVGLLSADHGIQIHLPANWTPADAVVVELRIMPSSIRIGGPREAKP